MLETLAQTLPSKYCRLEDKRGCPFSVVLFRGGSPATLSVRRMYECFEPKECAQGLPPRDRDRRETWLESLLRQRLNLLALRGDQVLGHAVLLDMKPGSTGEYLVFVHQEHQDRGIGSALTGAARDLAQGLGYCQLWLTVGMLNARAIHVYEKAGFRRVGPPDSEWEMAAQLRPPGECG